MGELSGVNCQRLPYLANLIFGFGTTFRCCPVFENIGKARTKNGTLPCKRSCLPGRQLLNVLRMLKGGRTFKMAEKRKWADEEVVSSMDLWAEETVRSIFECRSEVEEYHC